MSLLDPRFWNIWGKEGVDWNFKEVMGLGEGSVGSLWVLMFSTVQQSIVWSFGGMLYFDIMNVHDKCMNVHSVVLTYSCILF